MTTYFETDALLKVSPVHGLYGGAWITGMTDSSSNPILITGVQGVEDPTDTYAAVLIGGAKKSGTSITALGALETVFQIENGLPQSGTDLVTVLGNGNVGIGTVSPTEKLEVSGNFSANNTLYVTEDGKVGIGTASPNAKLEVAGNTNITSGNLTVEGDITFTGELHGSVVIGCPSGMVRVGAPGGFCIDKYEAYNAGAAPAVDLNHDGDTLDGVLIYDEYVCEDGTADGGGGGVTAATCDGFSQPGTSFNQTPYVSLTQNQAHAACLSVEKRLCTNYEWHLAAQGTPDPDATVPTAGTEPCNIWTSSKPTEATWSVTNAATKTGTALRCLSNVGAYDMVGNVWEWNGDTIQDGIHPFVGGALPAQTYINGVDQYGIPSATGASSANYNEDHFWINAAGRRAFLRGGRWNYGAVAGVFALNLGNAPSASSTGVGFRCCK